MTLRPYLPADKREQARLAHCPRKATYAKRSSAERPICPCGRTANPKDIYCSTTCANRYPYTYAKANP